MKIIFQGRFIEVSGMLWSGWYWYWPSFGDGTDGDIVLRDRTASGS